jgi:DNA-nicking Smr family endonuclease
MAKRPKDSPPRAPKPAPFNNPFSGLKAIKEAEAAKAAAEAKAKRAPPPPPPSRAPPPRDDDAELFLQAMDGVLPIQNRGAAAEPPRLPLPQRVNDDAEALASLAELVSGEGSFELADSAEYIQGSAADLDRRVVTALRRGDYPVQARLDLHGRTRVEAREAVEQFLTRSRREGKRCVLIVHGRGLNSADQIPVLKESVQSWLVQGRLGRGVLAFATARPQDGGAGAVYVLLRKGRG